MLTTDLLLDAFSRVQEVTHEAVKGLSEEQLKWRPDEKANSIAWLVWHLARTQDDHIADVAGHQQIYTAEKWAEKFGFPFAASATGYGQRPKEVAAVQANAKLLLGYYDAVHAATLSYLHTLKPADYDRVVDERWDPPVTLAVRLVSVISDDLQHAGQAAYLRGLLP